MKTCPACHKESASDTECLNCGIFFAKWEALHGGARPVSTQTGAGPSDAAPSGAAPSDDAIPPYHSEEPAKRSNTSLLLISALVFAGIVWFSQRGSSEKEIRQRSLAFHAAISAGDLSQMKDLVSGKYAGEFSEAGTDIKLKMIQAFQPADIKIMDIKVKGKEAVVAMQGSKDGSPVNGTTRMVKERGGWKVSHQEWEFTMPMAGPADAAVPDMGGAFPAQPDGQTGSFQVSGGNPTPSKPSSASGYAVGMHSPTDEKFGASLKTMSIPELLAALKKEQFYTYKIVDALLARGERTQLVNTLNEMLRDKRGNKSASPMAKKLLKQAGAPVTFDWDLNLWDTPPEDKYSLMEWEIEMRGNSIVTSGKVYIGQEVADGFTRPQKNEFTLPTYAKYEFTVTGPGLARPEVKVVEAQPRAGEQPWNDITLASGLTRGEYMVRIYTNAQTVQKDGTPMSLNHNPPPLQVEKD